jgi:Flp pilus assembly protein CpaB
MKKNLVPLLGIAFVVAILSTAIFYGLIASKLTGDVQAKANSRSTTQVAELETAGLGVPVGMRAVSVHVSDSSGILDALKPGHRVDIQAVYTRSSNPQEVELRRILQNIEVWKVTKEPQPSSGRHPLPVVSFLTSPMDADVLALADSGARIRLALRHPEDREIMDRPSLDMDRRVRPRANRPRPDTAQAVPLTPLKATDGAACVPQPVPLGTPVR